jgi:hypothetical protein
VARVRGGWEEGCKVAQSATCEAFTAATAILVETASLVAVHNPPLPLNLASLRAHNADEYPLDSEGSGKVIAEGGRQLANSMK